MPNCIFVSDLHGEKTRCRSLFELLESEPPEALFIGGDLLPSGFGLVQQPHVGCGDFLTGYFLSQLARLKETLSDKYPRIFVILGNDDPAAYEKDIISGVKQELWEYSHFSKATLMGYSVYGYSFVPPTPFLLKDWEKYDVSRYVDPGAVSPEEGFRSKSDQDCNPRHETIERDLKKFVGVDDLSNAIFLFHSPPYNTNLDRAALDGKMVDHVPLDVHVGSIAIRRLIERKRPLLSLHGHIHESTTITGSWREKIGRTHMFNAAHDGPELSVVKFNLKDLSSATRLVL